MAWVAAGFLVVGFVALAKLLRLAEHGEAVVALSRRSLAIVRDTGLSDETKESALQENAKRLFWLAFLLAGGAGAAILMPAGLVWMCDRIGWLSFESVCTVALSPTFIAVSCVVLIVSLFVSLRSRRTVASTPQRVDAGVYSGPDRLLHRVAFRTVSAQLAVADVEDRLFAARLASCKAERPVFVTAIPRAGTTMLLECCARLPEFASHCYRDMPFVLTPCLWNQFSGRFRRDAEQRERAHGDGMLVGFDSPEALEEVIWKAFWRSHYHNDRIAPWKCDEAKDAQEFSDFFRSHMRKILFVRRGLCERTPRYFSKNNLNIARLKLLHKLFPDASIIVPFREPRQHAESLLKQHRNFLAMHKGDPFASEYMRAIGHYEFGDNLRPVDFDGWFDGRQSRQADSLAFWLEYWAVAYRHILTEGGEFVRLVNYDALCRNPHEGLSLLADAVDCRDRGSLLAQADGIHAARVRTVDTTAVPASILEDVASVYADLETAVRGGGR